MAGKSAKQENRSTKVDSVPVPPELYDTLLTLRSKFAVQARTLSANSLAVERQAGEDLADVGSDSFMRDTELSLMGEDDNKIRLIDAALKRIDEGTYGVCAECGNSIPERRLKAIPYVDTCLKCQEEIETKASKS